MPPAEGVAGECANTHGRVGRPGGIASERIDASGRVVVTGGIEQKRRSTGGRIGIPVVENQRSSAKSGIEVASRIQKERAPTDACVSSTGREGIERSASFRGREPRIAPIRRGNNCVC